MWPGHTSPGHSPEQVGTALAAQQEGDDPQRSQSPEREHSLDEVGTHLLELGAELALELGEALLELRVGAREIEFVQRSEISPVGGVHGVEPVHQFVGNLVPEGLAELPRQLGSDRQCGSRVDGPVANLNVGSARSIGKTVPTISLLAQIDRLPGVAPCSDS